MKELKLIISLISLSLFSSLHAQDATEIIRKADEKMTGEKTSKGEMRMKIIRPTWERTISFKTWTKGRDYSLTLVTAPAREKGQTFLMRKNEMWNWNPTISRMIKLPPSMMSQGWMGSDYANDDLLKESSVVTDYHHTLIGEEKVNGIDCYKIRLEPREDAAVVWGKMIKWISRDEYLQLKTEYYDEDGYLIKTELAYDIETMDGRRIPTRFELIPEEEEGHKTLFYIEDIEFNVPIPDSFFSQQNMKRVR